MMVRGFGCGIIKTGRLGDKGTRRNPCFAVR
jgi:hypothetical protein